MNIESHAAVYNLEFIYAFLSCLDQPSYRLLVVLRLYLLIGTDEVIKYRPDNRKEEDNEKPYDFVVSGKFVSKSVDQADQPAPAYSISKWFDPTKFFFILRSESVTFKGVLRRLVSDAYSFLNCFLRKVQSVSQIICRFDQNGIESLIRFSLFFVLI